MRLNLLSKILLWVFINLLVLGVVLFFIFNLQFNFSPNSPLLGAANERIEVVAEMIATESNGKSRAERDEILKKYSDNYGVTFTLFTNSGEQLGGQKIELPAQIKDSLGTEFKPPPGMPANLNLPPPPRRVSIERTTSPTIYWAIARVPIVEKGKLRKHQGFGHRIFGFADGKRAVSQSETVDHHRSDNFGFIGVDLVSVHLEFEQINFKINFRHRTDRRRKFHDSR